MLWLRAQLDADERIARAAGGVDWLRPEHPGETVAIFDSKGEPVVYDEGWPTEEQQAHIATHDPARVLREIEAKRRIVRAYEAAVAAFNDSGPAMANYDRLVGSVSSLRGSLERLAEVYADRPGFQESWRP